jgi:hypothetical protein
MLFKIMPWKMSVVARFSWWWLFMVACNSMWGMSRHSLNHPYHWPFGLFSPFFMTFMEGTYPVPEVRSLWTAQLGTGEQFSHLWSVLPNFLSRGRSGSPNTNSRWQACPATLCSCADAWTVPTLLGARGRVGNSFPSNISTMTLGLDYRSNF